MRPVVLASTLVAALAAAATAHAGGVRAHLECTPAGGKLLKATQTASLDTDTTCAVVVDAGTLPADAEVAVTATVGTPAGPVPGAPHAAKATDGKHFTADGFAVGVDLLTCAATTFDGTITSGKKQLWKGTVAVKPTCAAPKPIEVKLGCAAMVKDVPIEFPGKGDKEKPDLDAGLTCTTALTTDDADAKNAVFAIHGVGPVVKRPLGKMQNTDHPLAFYQMMTPPIPKCKSFVVDAAVLRADGAVLWKGSIPIAQSCKKAK